MRIRSGYNRCSILSFWLTIVVILGCCGCKEADPTAVETDQNTIVNISIVPGGIIANSGVHFTVIVQPLPKVPYICVWNFKDSTGDQYSQDNATMVHYFNTPGTYLVHLFVLNAYTGDTIGSIARPFDVIEEVHTPIYQTLQTMHRISVLFTSKKQYTFVEAYNSIESNRINYTLSSGLTVCGRTGVYQYSSNTYDYWKNNYNDAGTRSEEHTSELQSRG